MNPEENDALWKLLGEARLPRVSTFFAGDVLRAIREREAPKVGMIDWLRRKWFLPLTAGACAAVLVFFATRAGSKGPVGDPLEEMAVVAVENSEITPSLDDLLASEDHSIWLAADPSSLF